MTNKLVIPHLQTITTSMATHYTQSTLGTSHWSTIWPIIENSSCTWKLLLKTASPLMTTCHVYNQCVGIITYVTADVTRHNAVCVWPIAYTPGVFVMLKATVGLQRKNDLFFSRQTIPGTCTVGVSVFGRESLGMWMFSDSRSTQRCHCSRTMDTHLHLANLSIT